MKVLESGEAGEGHFADRGDGVTREDQVLQFRVVKGALRDGPYLVLAQVQHGQFREGGYSAPQKREISKKRTSSLRKR